MPINITSVPAGAGAASGLAVGWDGGQIVIIAAKKGLVACGIVDMAVAEKFGFAVAIARGTPEKPLVTADDLLEASIAEVSAKGAEYGILKGMSGREALEKLS
ncbi:MAG TPA: DUF1805 domain-containing protein [Spirochaetota bacterium]|jgi:uncharacterized protein YunC (DUF1805 family)|nr:DUF1805 domain-containing protein [Spirochaetota bacterium]HPV39538.1 DUF1805 domain-containing protein [Spirochaetota bacterium]